MGVLVVTGGDESEILEASEHALDDAAAAITFPVEGLVLPVISLIENDRPDAPPLQPSPQMVGGVASLTIDSMLGALSMCHKSSTNRVCRA